MATAWLTLCLAVVCLIFGCGALSLRLNTGTPLAPPTPGLQADYSPWLPTRFSPVLDSLLLEAAQELRLTGSEAGVPAEACLLPQSSCTPEPPQGAGWGGEPVDSCPAEAGAKCKPSSGSGRP
jgi:hypothetical protein